MVRHVSLAELVDTPVGAGVVCAGGCVISGSHRRDVGPEHEGCGVGCPRGCGVHCGGCLPRRASGALRVCGWCADRVRVAVGEVPAVVTWVRTQDVRALANGFGVPGARREPPVPVSVDALDAADELHAILVSWVRTVVEEHPGKLRGPDLRGSVSARSVLADRWGPVVGLAAPAVPRGPAGRVVEDRELVVPAAGAEGPVAVRYTRKVDRLSGGAWDDGDWVSASAATAAASAWLLNMLPWALEQDWAGVMVGELVDALATVEARWPRAPRPEVTTRDCFDCGSPLLRTFGDEGRRDETSCPRCRVDYTPARYKLAAADHLAVVAEERRVADALNAAVRRRRRAPFVVFGRVVTGLVERAHAGLGGDGRVTYRQVIVDPGLADVVLADLVAVFVPGVVEKLGRPLDPVEAGTLEFGRGWVL